MKLHKALWLGALLAIVCCFAAPAVGQAAEERVEEAPVDMVDAAAETTIVPKQPLVQMAILLDTSGSMSGLINQARAELWAIVNEFIFAKKNGRQPEIQVALYEYGKSSLAQKDGYIRQIVPLTTDLDKISEDLFALRTNGGSEYCGWVIQEAAEHLQWRDSPDDLKVIFIAGNEPFTQGPVDYRQACRDAVAKGIVVNTIHCGPESRGIEGKWKDGALLADGRYLNIDQNRQIAHIPAPQDQQIAELSRRLNETYLAYGAEARQYSMRQEAQDRNAATLSVASEVQRAVAKSSANYRNSQWDLVDALEQKQIDLEKIAEEQLPKNMRKMTAEQRRAYVQGNAKDRAEIQKQIQTLNEQRKKHVAEEMKKRSDGERTLGSAVIQAIRQQAARIGFTFKQPETPPSDKDAKPAD